MTIAAVLTAALLLPGIIGLSIFYSTVGTRQVKVTPPPLGTITALAVAGSFAIVAHLLWSMLLAIEPSLPAIVPLPPLDPYRLIFLPQGRMAGASELAAGMAGMAMTCVVGALVGRIAAAGDVPWRGRMLFGWLYPIIQKAAPDRTYINAYVVTKIENGADRLGYEGTVENLVLNEQRQIVGVTLVNVSTFYLRLEAEGVRRLHAGSGIRHLVLRDIDYHNVALVVIRDETAGSS